MDWNMQNTNYILGIVNPTENFKEMHKCTVS